jgi:L-fuculose-phosphate aldolase
VLLRNHGVVTVGTTVGEAVMWAIFLDQACRKQLLALQCGGARQWSPAEEAEVKKRKHAGQPGSGRMDVAFAYYVRQIKKIEGKP